MTDLSIKTTVTEGQGDYRWLRTRHADDNTVSVTVPYTLLDAGTHYDDKGVIPSGLPLGKVTGAQEWGPYDPDADDGRQHLAGFLLDPVALQADFAGVSTKVLHVAMVVHGIIDPSFVPGNPTLDNTTPTTGQFVFFDVDYVGSEG
ncbi:MAG: head decoration protein [Propionibacteriaceae bacterium]|nr:head decoration protein [Propionibacteriaceae bacterium]